MKLEVKYFGMIAEKLCLSEESIEINFTEEFSLQEFFQSKYPVLTEMEYKIAIDQSFSTQLNGDENKVEIALLPPFAGG